MDGKALAIVGAIMFAAVAATAAAIDLVRKDESSKAIPVQRIVIEAVDPLREAIVRCQQMGEAAASDADCLAAWAQNRRRFLGRDEER